MNISSSTLLMTYTHYEIPCLYPSKNTTAWHGLTHLPERWAKAEAAEGSKGLGLRCNSLILFDCCTSAGICWPHLIHVHCWPIRSSSLAALKIRFLSYWVTELHERYSIYKCMILAGSDEYISVTLRPQSFFVRLAGGVLMFKTLGL